MAEPTSPGAHHPHGMDPTTRTVEVTQIQEINDRLSDHAMAGHLTAEVLGLADHAVERLPGVDEGLPARLPADARLTGVVAEGPPEFPYVWGCFTSGRPIAPGRPGRSVLVVPLHTQALTRTSRLLGLTGHHWGLGAAAPAEIRPNGPAR